jgi:hypothetical protein
MKEIGPTAKSTNRYGRINPKPPGKRKKKKLCVR